MKGKQRLEKRLRDPPFLVSPVSRTGKLDGAQKHVCGCREPETGSDCLMGVGSLQGDDHD